MEFFLCEDHPFPTNNAIQSLDFVFTVGNLVLVSLVTTNLTLISHLQAGSYVMKICYENMIIYANVIRVGVIYFYRTVVREIHWLNRHLKQMYNSI